jgi:hypothetical protein
VYDFVFPIRKPGAYQLRVALRDHATDKVGSANQFIEVPDLKKNRLTISGVALENIGFAAWEKLAAGVAVTDELSDPLMDTSLRRFKRGTVLSYGFAILNAKAEAGRPPNLTANITVFRDGKLLHEGHAQAVPFADRSDPTSVNFTGALNLGSEMEPGDYILQITVRDNLAKNKHKYATQFVQFEVIE